MILTFCLSCSKAHTAVNEQVHSVYNVLKAAIDKRTDQLLGMSREIENNKGVLAFSQCLFTIANHCFPCAVAQLENQLKLIQCVQSGVKPVVDQMKQSSQSKSAVAVATAKQEMAQVKTVSCFMVCVN